jgi:lysophospholipase L1-like esterase
MAAEARPRRAASLALALGSLLAALLAAEGILRAIGFTSRFDRAVDRIWVWIRYDPVLNRKNQPRFAQEALGIRINSLGFRGDEIDPRKPAGTVRVACLGDSATFGMYLDGRLAALHTSYPGELARLLAAEGPAGVEVINAGVLGHTTGEGLAQLLTRVLPLAPDVVTVRFGNNDHLLLRTGQLPPAWYVWDWAALRLLPASAFGWELVRLAFHGYRQALALRAPPARYRVPLDRFERNLRRFVRIGRAHGVRVLFVDFPYRDIARGESPGQAFPDYFTDARSLAEFHAIHERYQAAVARVADETGTPLLRTADAFQRSPTPVFTDFDLSHPNEAGIALLARVLFEDLAQRGWLAPPGRHAAP